MNTHEIEIFENSQLVKKQNKTFSKVFKEGRKTICIQAVVRWDDECGNKKNSFSITGCMGPKTTAYRGDVFSHDGVNYRYKTGGCIHDEIRKHFPELRHLIKYHLMDSKAPMYFFENSQYWAKQGNLESARSCAVWPDATLEDILDDEKMLTHLDDLMPVFKSEVEKLGFIW